MPQKCFHLINLSKYDRKHSIYQNDISIIIFFKLLQLHFWSLYTNHKTDILNCNISSTIHIYLFILIHNHEHIILILHYITSHSFPSLYLPLPFHHIISYHIIFPLLPSSPHPHLARVCAVRPPQGVCEGECPPPRGGGDPAGEVGAVGWDEARERIRRLKDLIRELCDKRNIVRVRVRGIWWDECAIERFMLRWVIAWEGE